MNRDLRVELSTITIRSLRELNLETLPRNYKIWPKTAKGDEGYEKFKRKYEIKYRDQEINATSIEDFLEDIELVLMESEFEIERMSSNLLKNIDIADFITQKNITISKLRSLSESELLGLANANANSTSNSLSDSESLSNSESKSDSDGVNTGWENSVPTGNVKTQLPIIKNHASGINASEFDNNSLNKSKDTSKSKDSSQASGTSETTSTTKNNDKSKTNSFSNTENLNVDKTKIFYVIEKMRELNFDVDEYLLKNLRSCFLSVRKIERTIKFYL